jgi:hypothetical protein
MPPAFCTEDDVRDALEEHSSAGPLGDEYIAPTIEAVSRWFLSESGAFFYDTGNNITDTSNVTIPSSARSASTNALDVPSSPHRQEGQLFASTHDRGHVRYPVTHAGRYAKIRLPHRFTETVTKLDVRDYRGGVTDWVAASDKSEGRDADYYVTTQGVTSHGVSHLYINADSLGARENFTDLIDIEYDYGLDYNSEAWDDVRWGIATLAAADLVHEDNVLAQIPDNGQLVGVDTQRDALLSGALGEAWSLLSPWLSVEVA